MVSKKKLEPPKARKKNKKIKVHGLVVKDDYSWLRDDNWQEVLRKPNVFDRQIWVMLLISGVKVCFLKPALAT